MLKWLSNKQRIIFVCDGAYFTDKKIKELKNLKGSWNFIILKSEELEKYFLKVKNKA